MTSGTNTNHSEQPGRVASGNLQQIATHGNKEISQAPAKAHYSLMNKNLSQAQQNALMLLLQGHSDAEVAQQVGVDRTCIFRWRSGDGRFRWELERQRHFLWQQSATRLQAMIRPALDILQKQMTSGDPKTAMRAAAILLRFATPGRLNRGARLGADRSEDDALDAYINAPLPGPTSLDLLEPQGR